MPSDVVFRADASLNIGGGHIMRCLTLADTLSESGYRSHFICRDLRGHLKERILQQGHGLTLLPPGSDPEADNMTAHGRWLEADWREDAEQTRDEVGRLRPAWLIVDHYALDSQWEQKVSQPGFKIGVIDDLADRPHRCDWLLDQNLGHYQRDYTAKVPDGCLCLMGPDYALLRPEFAQWRSYSLSRRERRPALRQVLVSLGGVDKNNVTGKILNALPKVVGLHNVDVTVVLGEQCPWASEVRQQLERSRLTGRLLTATGNMAQLLAESDLCIGAGGGSAWERCCLGVPSVVLVLADNQADIARRLEAHGAAAAIDARNGVPHDFPETLTTLVSNWCQWSQEAAGRGAGLIDGLGSRRAAKALLELTEALR